MLYWNHSRVSFPLISNQSQEFRIVLHISEWEYTSTQVNYDPDASLVMLHYKLQVDIHS